MSSTLAGQQRFDLGRVFQRTFHTIGGNPKILWVAAVVLAGLPEFFFRTPVATFGFGWSYFASTVVGVLAMILLQGIAAHVTVAGMQGRKAQVEDTVQALARAFPVLIAAGLLSALGIAVGLIFLVVPGLYLLMLWFVVGPVAMAEKASVRVAFERSQDLTEGHRWWLLLLVVIVLVATWFLGVATLFIGVLTWGVGIARAIVDVATQTVTSLVIAVGVASVYAELRLVKEGGGRETVAAVFD